MKKIAIITGASSGIGKCFSIEVAQESLLYPKYKTDEIWLIARRIEKLEETKNEIQRISGHPTVRTINLDISGKDGAKGLAKLLESEKENGDFCISLLINNAGFGSYGEFANTDTEREMDMIDVNCTALTGITGFSLPYMQKGSRIIMTASLASFCPLGNFAVYGATKSYVLSFAIALAAELKHKGISVTALCPGPVSTEFANIASNGARKEVKHGLPATKTAKTCLKDSRSGKMYSMWAFKWKFRAKVAGIANKRFAAWATYKFAKRPSN